LVFVAAMIAAGFLCAIVVLLAYAIAVREGEEQTIKARVDQSSIAGSILYSIARAGEVSEAEAVRIVRERGQGVVATRREIDLSSWGEAFSRAASEAECRQLLEAALRVGLNGGRDLTLRSYNALLELSFALGFHSDALARLRDQYGFRYTDHAAAGRPREADRAGGGAPLFVRLDEPARLARMSRMGLDAASSRQELISRYRKLAAEHHPDRFHNATENERALASARFIEITSDYESLLSTFRED